MTNWGISVTKRGAYRDLSGALARQIGVGASAYSPPIDVKLVAMLWNVAIVT